MQPQAQPMPEDQESPDGGPPPESDENFVKAVNFARKVLYKDGGSDKINQIVQKMPNPSSHLATLAYEISGQADAATGGMVMDENLVSLATMVLSDVFEIAEASGVPVEPAQMAEAFKSMALKYLQENGIPTEQIEKAMSQLGPEQFNEINTKVTEIAESQKAAPPQEGMSQEVPA